MLSCIELTLKYNKQECWTFQYTQTLDFNGHTTKTTILGPSTPTPPACSSSATMKICRIPIKPAHPTIPLFTILGNINKKFTIFI